MAFLALLGTDASGRPARPRARVVGGTAWLNVRRDEALTIAALRNKVVLIEFWTGG